MKLPKEPSASIKQEIVAGYDYDPETGFIFSKGRSKHKRKVGAIDALGYVRVHVGARRFRAHHLAWFIAHGVWPRFEIDHINGIRHDNRLANLRESPHSINQENLGRARADNKVGLLGVSWYAAGKSWKAQIQVQGRKTHLGYHPTPEAAYAAYLAAKRALHVGHERMLCA